MHPYRGGASRRILDDDEDVRWFERRARRERRVSVALALTGALVLSFALIDWPFAVYVISGHVLAH